MTQAREGSFLTHARLRRWCGLLLAVEVLGLALCITHTHGWFGPLDQPVSTDFVSFYAAGRLADDGTPALAYDPAAHYAAEQAATEPGIAYNFFYYPPPFLLLCAALARLPYLLAFVLFQAACLVPCVVLARRIAGPVPIVAVLAFPAVGWAIGCGQNALLTGALMAGSLLALERRPVLAGVLLGALCYKPHLALLVPVALAAGGHWRTVAAAAASAGGLVAASAVAFGAAAWQAFLAAGSTAGSVYAAADAPLDLAGLTSPFGLVLALGGTPGSAAALQLAVSLGAAVAVGWAWRSHPRPAVRAALLLAAIPVATPAVMFYDLTLTGFALAWLVRDGREAGFPPWQRTALCLLFVLPLFSGNSGFALQIGRPPLVAALGLAVAVRQAVAGRRRANALPPGMAVQGAASR